MRLLAPLALIAVLIFGAFYWDRPQPPAEFTFVNRGEVITLDPQRMSWLQDFRIADALYEGLVVYDNETMEARPGVAHSWELSDDRRTYTFHLRPEARWSNGDPVTASDFVYAWQRGMLPDTASDYANLFLQIEGAQAFADFRTAQQQDYARRAAALAKEERAAEWERLRAELDAKRAELVGLHAPDPHTLVVTLEQPTPYMLDLFAFGVFLPVHRPTVEPYIEFRPDTGRIVQNRGWTKAGQLISNGPYTLKVWRYKRDMRLERNPFYWNAAAVRADSVACLSIEDANTAVLAFETGAIDWLSDVQAPYRADMLAQSKRYRDRMAPRLSELFAQGLDYDDAMATVQRESPPAEGERNDIHAFAAYGTLFYNFNCMPTLRGGGFNPFHDAAIRRAFTMAVDKHAIVSSVTRMNQPVADVLIPPGSIPGFNGAPGLGFDLVRARSELASAGWVDRDGDGLVENERGETFPVVEVLFPSGSEHKGIAEALASMWERHLSVKTRLVEEETKVQRKNLEEKNYMIGRGNWYGDYGDPTTFLDLNRTGDGNNDRGYSNPRFDAQLDEAAREPDPQKRMRLLEQADAIIVTEDVPFVPLYHQVTVYMYDPTKVRGISQHPRLHQFLHELGVVSGQ